MNENTLPKPVGFELRESGAYILYDNSEKLFISNTIFKELLLSSEKFKKNNINYLNPAVSSVIIFNAVMERIQKEVNK